ERKLFSIRRRLAGTRARRKNLARRNTPPGKQFSAVMRSRTDVTSQLPTESDMKRRPAATELNSGDKVLFAGRMEKSSPKVQSIAKKLSWQRSICRVVKCIERTR